MGQDRHVPQQHGHAAIRFSTGFAIRATTGKGTTGRSTPCTTSRTAVSDSVEGVTHSLCTLEFENNREIYDWLLEHVEAPEPRPEQTEFAPLALDYVITSKRRLKELVRTGAVRGWDDPRMPTLAGLRRRGVTPGAIRALCDMVGGGAGPVEGGSRQVRVRGARRSEPEGAPGLLRARPSAGGADQLPRRARGDPAARRACRAATAAGGRASCPSGAKSTSTGRTSRRTPRRDSTGSVREARSGSSTHARSGAMRW